MVDKKQEVITKIEKHGFKFVSFEEQSIGTNFLTKVECNNGHQWVARPNTFLESRRANRISKGCPQCAAEIKNIASQKKAQKNLIEGHEILSHFNKIGATGIIERQYSIRCPSNHIYNKSNRTISHGCPQCNKVTLVGQERTRLIFETQFETQFPSIRPNWLKNPVTGNNLELDGYCEQLKIAFEYQGRQHFSNDTQFGGDYNFQARRDKLKAQICLNHGIKLITITQPRSYSAEKFFNSVMSDCNNQGINITVTHSDCRFNKINDTNTAINKYKEFKDFVESKNYKILTSSLSTMQDSLEFECMDGHKFKMTPENFKTAYSRPQYNKIACTVCNNKHNSHKINSLITIDTCKKMALDFGYTLESTAYSNINSPLSWICTNGHSLSKSFRQMIRNQTGQYCHTCKEMKLENSLSLLKPKVTSKISKSLSGEVRDINWLNTFTGENNIANTDGMYLGMDIKHNFCCSKGHRFSSTISALIEKEKKKTSMCPDYSCGGKNLGLEECKNFARKNGITCLTEKYENVNSHMNWLCDKGHTFTKSFRQFQRSKTSKHCPQCP